MTKHMSNRIFVSAILGIVAVAVAVAVLVLALAPGSSGDEPVVEDAEAEVVDEAAETEPVVASSSSNGKASKGSSSQGSSNSTPTTDAPGDDGQQADPADPGNGNGGGNGKPQINPEIVEKFPQQNGNDQNEPQFDPSKCPDCWKYGS